jgi:hypothetical protein
MKRVTNDYTHERRGPLDDDRALAWLLWTDLRECLRGECERHNHNDETPVFAYDHPSTLTYHHVAPAEVKLRYSTACCCPGDHWLRITFDLDLLHLRFTAPGTLDPYDLLAVVRDDRAHFETRDHSLLSAEQAGRFIVNSLQIRFVHTKPPKPTIRLSDLYPPPSQRRVRRAKRLKGS